MLRTDFNGVGRVSHADVWPGRMEASGGPSPRRRPRTDDSVADVGGVGRVSDLNGCECQVVQLGEEGLASAERDRDDVDDELVHRTRRQRMADRRHPAGDIDDTVASGVTGVLQGGATVDGDSLENGSTMHFKQFIASRIFERYLQIYSARMRMVQSRWTPNIVSTDPTKRREGLVLLYEFHDACHEGALNSMWLKPTDVEAELSIISLATTLDGTGVSLSDVEFAVLERDTAKIEVLAKQNENAVAAGYTEKSDQESYRWKGQNEAQRSFEWHHGQLYNVAGIFQQIAKITLRAERLPELEGKLDILARLRASSDQMDADYRDLTHWLDTHINDQPY